VGETARSEKKRRREDHQRQTDEKRNRESRGKGKEKNRILSKGREGTNKEKEIDKRNQKLGGKQTWMESSTQTKLKQWSVPPSCLL
jgi:hypothetical protein